MNEWPRVKELFHAALECEPAERAAFLNASCADDPVMRAEVERLLAAHGAAGEFIEQSPVALTGRVIGHYKIDRAVASGGMGQVYLAHDLELGRTVAVKIALGSGALEPRYVLELARLLEKTGDTKSALNEYERFLELWKRADPELPELDEARRAVARLRTSRSG